MRFHAPNQPDWNALDNVAARSHVARPSQRGFLVGASFRQEETMKMEVPHPLMDVNHCEPMKYCIEACYERSAIR